MISAVIVAAGSSERMGFDKLAAELAGKSVLLRSLEAFERCGAINEIILVADESRAEAMPLESISKLAKVVPGGSARHRSVARGLQACHPDASVIAVHDGARPLVTPQAVERTVHAAWQHGAAALAHRITDTLKRARTGGVDEGGTPRVDGSVSREDLWAMETPQAFRADWLQDAYTRLLETGTSVTDEVSAVEAAGHPVVLVENAEPNPKITYPADLALAEALLRGLEAVPSESP